MKKIKINSRVCCSYDSDGKVTTCHLHLIFKNDLVKLLDPPKSDDIIIQNDTITIKTLGKSICHDDDGFDEKLGRKIAQKRAYIKALKNLNNLLLIIQHKTRDDSLVVNNTRSSLYKLNRQYIGEIHDIKYYYESQIYSD